MYYKIAAIYRGIGGPLNFFPDWVYGTQKNTYHFRNLTDGLEALEEAIEFVAEDLNGKDRPFEIMIRYIIADSLEEVGVSPCFECFYDLGPWDFRVEGLQNYITKTNALLCHHRI